MKRGALAAVAVVAALSAGCSALIGPEATPVPGAAATLTRSINTPIPTPVRRPSAVPGASPSPVRVAVPASPAAAPGGTAQPLSDADVSAVQRQIEQALAVPSLPGIDALLLDHVSLSTPSGGSVLNASDAAAWLRDRAGPGIRVTQVDRGTQEVMLQVQTQGWPANDPIQQGNVNFSLRRYDANGRQDETGAGEWKIDVIEAE